MAGKRREFMDDLKKKSQVSKTKQDRFLRNRRKDKSNESVHQHNSTQEVVRAESSVNMEENIFKEHLVQTQESTCEESPVRMEESICEELYSQIGNSLDNTDELVKDVSMETTASCNFDLNNSITSNNNDPTLKSVQPMQLDLSNKFISYEHSKIMYNNESGVELNINEKATSNFPQPLDVTNELTRFEILDITLKGPQEKTTYLNTNERYDDLTEIKTKDYDPNLNVAAPPPSVKFDDVTYSPISRTPTTNNNSTRNNSPLLNLFSDLDSPIPFEKQIKSIATMDPEIYADTPTLSDQSNSDDDVVQKIRKPTKTSAKNYSLSPNLISDLHLCPDNPIPSEEQIISIAASDAEMFVETPMPSDVSDFGDNVVHETKRAKKNKFSIKRFVKKNYKNNMNRHKSTPKTPQQNTDINCTQVILEDNENSSSTLTTKTKKGGKRQMTKKNNPGKKRERNESKWLDKVRKVRCNLGKSYKSRNGTIKEKRRMKEPCTCKLQCFKKIPEILRKKIFKTYWSLGNHTLQWNFIIKYVKRMEKRRDTTEHREFSRRTFTFKYFLPISNVTTPVCQVMFLNTLGISKMMVYTALDKNQDAKVTDNRGKHGCHKTVICQEMVENVVNHVNEFKPVESHYVRKDTSRKYLDSDLTFQKMFKYYKEWCNANAVPESIRAKTLRQYQDIVNKHMNIGFFVPKKDICDVCHQYKNIESPSEQQKLAHAQHLEAKKITRDIKSDEKELAKNNSDVLVATFDFQKVLTCPHGEISVFYYKRKLNLYNFTVFELASKTGTCYMWHEGIAKRGSNEVASCLYDFIDENAKKGVVDFRFWSDNCTGQNRNRIVFFMYAYVAKKLNVKISHKFLEKGHTQNEGDSVHALIERSAKGKTIYSPDEWYALIRWCKTNDPMYIVKEVKQSEIFDFKAQLDTKQWTKNTENEKVLWTEVKEVFVDFTLNDDGSNKEDAIFYKLNLSDKEYKTLKYDTGRPIQTRRRNLISTVVSNKELAPAYTKPIPLPSLKVKDFLSLCQTGTIPDRFHNFYKSLKSSPVATASDSEGDN